VIGASIRHADPAAAPPVFTARGRAVLAAWVLAAVANLLAGVVIASWPGRQTDLESVRRWGAEWLLVGVNVYGADPVGPDYPPHAVVALSPLAVLPAAWAVPFWIAVNLALALAAPLLAVRAVRPAANRFDTALLVAMLLCWGGFRTLLQFSLLALTLGLAAMVVADRRAGWSGVALGLALIKPQVAAPFLLWAVFTRRLRVAGTAVAVTALGFGVFCLRAHANPADVVRSYAATLHAYYLGDAIMTGLSNLRPVIALAAPDAAVADGVAGAVALLMLVGICALGAGEGRRRDAVMYSAPALAGLWSLLTFYHLTYGFLVLLPAAVMLVAGDDARTSVFRRRLFWMLQIALMVDLPGAWRRVSDDVRAPEAVNALFVHFDRVLMLGLFLCVAALAITARLHHAGRGKEPNATPSLP
jgi:hypothetical protein